MCGCEGGEDSRVGCPTKKGGRAGHPPFVEQSGVGRFVVFDVCFRGLAGVVRSVLVMTVRKVRVVSGHLMLAVFVMLGGQLVMSSRVFVMLRCCVMMIRCNFRHDSSMRLR
jgi:hypothetical protein